MNPNHRKHALAVLTTPRLQADRNDLAALQSVAVQQLVAISYIEKRAAVCAILAGITLWRVKASLPHGQFRSWIESVAACDRDSKCPPDGGHLKSGESASGFEPVRKSQANNYMRLASAFVEKSRVDEKTVLAAPADHEQLSLESGDAAAQRFAKKLKAFVGDCSLTDLLVKHGIKGVARDPVETKPRGDGSVDPKTQIWVPIQASIQTIQSALNDSDRVHYLGDEEYTIMENHLRALLNLIDERRPRRRGPVVDV